jgi:Ca-activated chloride channel family protein
MIEWQNPWAFLLLLPVLAIVAWAYWRDRRRSPTLQVPSVAALAGPKIQRGWRSYWLWLPPALAALGLILVVVALARPQRADTKVRRNVEGIDIMLVLDVSDSMLIEDMTPNRLEASKTILKQFIEKRSTDRIGLVVFSGESYTRVPLTLDYKILLQSLAGVKISRNMKMGTAIGVALANGVARLRDSSAKSRVLVFLTDGENNSGTIDPETALEMAKGYGLKIYAIGAGRDGEAQLPVETVDLLGRKSKRYQPIHSKVNDELLGRFASETGGKYYRATDNDSLKRVFDDINRMEKTKIEVNQYTRYQELFQQWLRWGVMALLTAWLLQVTILRRGPT